LNQILDRSSDDALTLTAPARLKRVGREMRMLVNGCDDPAAAEPSLLRIIVRAHDVQGRLSQNAKLTVHDIAREEGVTAAYLYNLLRLPWLAPDITTAIVNGRQPRQLNAMTLMRKASRLPADWAAQRMLLGFWKIADWAPTILSRALTFILAPRRLSQQQQKSQPRIARWEIFVVTRAKRTTHIRLCGMRHARNARRFAAKCPKTKHMQYQYFIWLGRQDSNLRMAESKSDYSASNINTHPLIKSNQITRLSGIAPCECRMNRTGIAGNWQLLTPRFVVLVPPTTALGIEPIFLPITNQLKTESAAGAP
jgi:hypothetical protein